MCQDIRYTRIGYSPEPRRLGTMPWARTDDRRLYSLGSISQGVDTVLNLGAGLDTRPYRLDLPESLIWIEADYPHIVDFKEDRLSKEKPRCQLQRVKLDLSSLPEREPFLASVNARANEMLILTEGVIPYLSLEEAASLADDLKTLDHAAYWIVEYISPQASKYRGNRRMRQLMQNAPFKFAPKNWFGFSKSTAGAPGKFTICSTKATASIGP
ncbi:MAG TPA: class I SAM-dependent methyltransferase [Verrucomicrobiae bacterium]|nr:class I SAM-dependent methyltransferase [Verrucomicrobiae bacterium]